VQAFTAQIASPTNDLDSVVRVLADLALTTWSLSPSRVAYARFFSELFKALCKAWPARDVETLLAAVRRMVVARLRLIAYRTPLMRRLTDTTSLTPVASIVGGVKASADVAFQPIDKALTEALAHAYLQAS
jgi:hypothetical protein